MARRYSEESQLKMINGARKSAEISKQKKEGRVAKYEMDPSLCSNCKKSLLYEKRKNKFCSHSCSASFNNKGTVRNLTDGKYRLKKCAFCEEETRNSKFCGKRCEQDYAWKKRKEEIERTGQITGVVTAKKYLAETRGDKCEICGLIEWQGEPITMIMDHINGDSDNNFTSNLRLICPNCDSQTPTYKGRNKGNGRHSRKMRYSEGKSY